MPHCPFYDSNDPSPCRVLRACTSGGMPEGIGGMLADRYCRGGSFILCPIYQRFERSIDAAHRDLRAMARRDNGSMGVFARG